MVNEGPSAFTTLAVYPFVSSRVDWYFHARSHLHGPLILLQAPGRIGNETATNGAPGLNAGLTRFQRAKQRDRKTWQVNPPASRKGWARSTQIHPTPLVKEMLDQSQHSSLYVYNYIHDYTCYIMLHIYF